MNRVYKVIWNEVTNTFVAVAEFVKSGRSAGKSVGPSVSKEVNTAHIHFFIKPLVAALICIGFTFASYAAPIATSLAPPSSTQLPTGGRVTTGAATVSQSGAEMTVTQSSENAAINWQTFNVGSQASVNFVQPSSKSVTLNRVLDTNPTQIYGQINANGTVFLENPNGVFFAPSASVSTGSFLATSANISDADLTGGNFTFNRNGATGRVVNKGRITSTLGGYIALLAPEVRNQGVVVAKGGTIVLAAGETYQLQFEANNTLTNILVSPSTIASYIKNGNAIEAPGGLIILSAQSANALQGGVIKNTGTISADGLVSEGGVIRLVASNSVTNEGIISADAIPSSSGSGGRISIVADLANPNSQTNVDGKLSAKGGDLGGDGGKIETSGSFVHVADTAQIDTRAPMGTGGTWILDPQDFTVGTGGDITGATLGTNLSSTSVSILSSSGATGASGNININDAVTWTGSSKLTLSAYNNINIDNAINVPATGSVSLVYGTGNSSGGYNFGVFAAGSNGFSGSINFAGTGANLYSTQQGSGSVVNYTVIDIPKTTIDTTGVKTSSSNYALGQNYTFSTSFTGSPISATFTGNFDGLGHTVNNLTGTGAIGLFANSSGTIQNVGVNMSTTSAGTSTGGLVNTNNGTILNSFASVSISGTSSTYGGLVGTNAGLVSNSFSTGSISGTSILGGLIGINTSTGSAKPSNISYTFSTVNINATGTYIGGLIGENTTTGTGGSANVSYSFATGLVSTSGANSTGGLIGYNFANGSNSFVQVSNSYSTGDVTGPSTNNGSNYYFGGLIGSNWVAASGANASVSNSYATGKVSATASWVGGLIGINDVAQTSGVANISNSYATGAVYNNPTSNANGTGGLIGYNRITAASGSALITNSYASGNVTGMNWTGGLIGNSSTTTASSDLSISGSYALGSVVGSTYVGGLVGYLQVSGAAKSNVSGSYSTNALNASNGLYGVSGTSYVGGLIGAVSNISGSSGAVSNITSSYSTSNVYGTTNVGGLIGYNYVKNFSTISSSYATGSVTGSSNNVGGFIGENSSDAGGVISISNSYATGNVVSTYSGANGNTGGFIGYNFATNFVSTATLSINNSYATGNVTALSSNVGGLIGLNWANSSNSSAVDASVSNSYATGSVSNTATIVANANYVGGLIGYNYSVNVAANISKGANITQSYATGDVTSNYGSYVGGLIGQNTSSTSSSNITSSYASGNVSANGTNGVGGLVGNNNTSGGYSNIVTSYSTGNVTLASTANPTTNLYAGGLVGWVNGNLTISNSYAYGAVTGVTGSYVGGLVGFLNASAGYGITNSYTTGVLSGGGTNGGLIGKLGAGTVSSSYWSTSNNNSLSPTYGGVGNNPATVISGVQGLSTTQMQNIANFSGWDTTNTWESFSYFNNQLPLLKNNNNLATIALVSGSSVYGVTPMLSYSITNSFGNAITGLTATGTPVWQLMSNGNNLGTQSLSNTTNAGVYSLTYSSGIHLGNYTIVSGSAANWTIAQAPLGISVAGLYSGSTTITPSTYSITGLQNSETLVPTSVTLNNANVASANNYVTAINTSTGSANLANYQITYSYNSAPNTTSTNTATLNPIALSVAEVASLSGNIYKASAYTGTYTTSAVVAADERLISVSGVASGTNAGTYTSNLVVSLTGSAITNYSTPSVTNASLVISPKPVTITNTSLTTTYDAVTTYAALAGSTNFTYTPLVGGDSINSVVQTASYAGQSVAQAGTYTVIPSNAQLAAGLPSNYQFNYVSSINTVNPVSLSVLNTVVAPKVYDGTTAAALSGGVLQGVLTQDLTNISLTQTGAFTSKNVGSAVGVTVNDSISGSGANNYTLIQPTGLTAAINPKVLTVTGEKGVNKVYDTTTNASLTGGSLVGVVPGDQVTLQQTGTFASPGVGNSIVIAPTNTLASSGDYQNYTLQQPSYQITANITPAVLTVSNLSALSKVYDGTTTATLTGTAQAQPLGQDQVTINGTPTGNYLDPNVGNNKYINVTGFNIAGPDASNYTLTGLHGVLGNITPATLTVTGLVANNKTYDSTTAATFTGGVISGLISGDQVSVNTGTFADKNVGTNKAVTAVLTGAQAGNYVANGLSGYSASINPASLNITGQVAANKVYDATAVATLSGGTLVGVFSGDSVNLVQTGNFPSKNVGYGLAVTGTNSLSGIDATNYSITQPTNLVANITPATVTVSGLSALSKVYDSTTSAKITGIPAVLAIGSDSISLTGSAVGSFSDANVGSSKAVLVSGLGLGGTDAANYILPTNMGLSADITPRGLTVIGSIVQNKVYDRSTDAIITGGSLVGVQGSDVITLTQQGSFADKNVGVNKSVIALDTVSGVLASNYVLTQPTGLVGTITPATLAVTGLNVSDKIYDGSATATLSGTATAHPLPGDSVTITGIPSASFSSVNAGNNIPVTVSNFVLSGPDAANYAATGLSGLSGNINPAPLTAQVNSFSKVYDGTVSAAPTLNIISGLVGNETLVVNATGYLDSKNVAEAGLVTVNSVNLSNGTNGGLASNYLLQAGQVGAASVTPATLTASLAAPPKVYDGTTTASPTMAITSGLIGSERIGVSVSGTYNTKDVATANLVTVNSITLLDGSNGGIASNYYLASGAATASSISPAPLKATITGVNTVYGTPASAGAVSLVGVVAGDSVSAVANVSSPSYSSSNNLKAGSYFQVASLAGVDAANYFIPISTSTSANYLVTPLALNVSSVGTVIANYGSPLSPGSVNLSGVLSGDLVGGVAAVANPVMSGSHHLNAGTYNQSVTALNGSDSNNYSLVAYTTPAPNYTVNPQVVVATISPASSIYGSSVTPGAVTLQGLLNGDSVSSVASVVSPVYSSSNHLSVGAYNQLAGALSGADAVNYSFAGYTTPAPNYTVTPLSVIGTITTSNSVSGAPLVPGTASLNNLIPGDNVGQLAVTVTIPGATAGSKIGNIVGTFARSQSVSGLTGPDASNYSFVDVKGDYSIKTGFSSATVFPSIMNSIRPSTPVGFKVASNEIQSTLQTNTLGGNSTANLGTFTAPPTASNGSGSTPDSVPNKSSQGNPAGSSSSSLSSGVDKSDITASMSSAQNKTESSIPSDKVSKQFNGDKSQFSNSPGGKSLMSLANARETNQEYSFKDGVSSPRNGKDNFNEGDLRDGNPTDAAVTKKDEPIATSFINKLVEQVANLGNEVVGNVMDPESLAIVGDAAASAAVTLQVIQLAASVPFTPIRLPLPMPTHQITNTLVRIVNRQKFS